LLQAIDKKTKTIYEKLMTEYVSYTAKKRPEQQIHSLLCMLPITKHCQYQAIRVTETKKATSHEMAFSLFVL